MVGRTDLLKAKEQPENERGRTIDLSAVLDHPYTGENNIKGEYDSGWKRRWMKRC